MINVIEFLRNTKPPVNQEFVLKSQIFKKFVS